MVSIIQSVSETRPDQIKYTVTKAVKSSEPLNKNLYTDITHITPTASFLLQ